MTGRSHAGPGCGAAGCFPCGLAQAAQCGTKVPYQSRALAENAAVLHELAGRPGMGAYPCPWCSPGRGPTWHIGHSTGSVRPLKRERRRVWRRAARRDPRSVPRPGQRPALTDGPGGPVSV